MHNLKPVPVDTKAPSRSLNDPPRLTLDFAHVCHLLLRKSWLIILCVVLSLLAAIAYLMQAPKIYESRAVIQIEQETPKVVKIQDINPEDFKSSEDLNTVEQALLSDTLLLRVVKANGLDKEPSFAPRKADGSSYLDSELAQRFKSRLIVRLRRGTRLIDIVVQDPDPKRAQQLAQSMVKEFIDQQFEQRSNVAKTANDFLLKEADHLKDKLHNSELAVQKYREDHNAVSLEEKQNIVVEKLRELNLKVTQARVERLRLEADLATLQHAGQKNPEELLQLASVAALPGVADLRRQIANKEAEYRAEGMVRGLKEALNRTLLNARDQVMKSYEAAKTTEASLQAALKEQEQAALELEKVAVPYNALRRDVDADRAVYDSVLSRLKETGVAKNLGESNLRSVQSPLVAKRPAKPKVPLILALALLAGFVCGIGIVIGLDMTDSSFRTVDEVEMFLGFPVLAALPESKRKSLNSESALHSDPASHEAEAFRSLRTSLSLLGREKNLNTVLFTSANPGEGKTYSSLNYAVALAQVGLRTLLIDADLRRRNLSSLMLLNPRAPGLSSCLSRRATITDCCRPTGIENLFILGAGQQALKPAELLASDEFANLLKEALLHFDRIVLDSAPINPVTDTQLIAKCVQSVCLIIRAGKTPRRAIFRACSRLAKANHHPDGIVFNRMAQGSRDSYYSAEYGHEYGHANTHGSEISFVWKLVADSQEAGTGPGRMG
jgi:capsular exopolysaccharide synthesis family protein